MRVPPHLSRFLLLALLASSLPACKPSGKQVAAYSSREQLAAELASARVVGADGNLGVDDILEIRVYQEPDLSGPFRVSSEGTIDYPFCGRLKVAGLTSSSLVDLLTGCLKNGYLKNPQVTVFLKEHNSKKIFVFGEVQKPGTFGFEQDMSIVQAITLAGGFGKLAAKNSVIVTRQVLNMESLKSEERKIKIPVEDIGEGREKNFVLQPGDIVYVPESFL